MDIGSQSDPFCVVFKLVKNRWQIIGKTEIKHDNLNPEFVKKVLVDFHFEQQECYKVEVFDSDDDSQQIQNLNAHDFLGSYEFKLHEVVSARDQIITRNLNHNIYTNGKAGRITIAAEEQVATANSEIVIFNPIGTLNENGLCFFIIYRNITLGRYTPIYKSEIKRPEGGLFRWNQVQLGSTDLCKDEIEREIKIEFFRSNPNGRHKNLASVMLNLAQIKEGTD